MNSTYDENTSKLVELGRCVNFGRFVAWVNVALVVPWLMFLVSKGDFAHSPQIALAVSPTVLALGLLYSRLHYFGRLLWLTCLLALSSLRTYATPSSFDTELMALVMLALPFLLFSPALERRTQTAMVIWAILNAIFALSADSFGWATSRQAPEGMDQSHINFGIRMTVVALLTAQMGYFLYLNRKLSADMQGALTQAQNAAQTKGAFLANMSHEIRTPMNGMIGMIEVLEADTLKPHQRPMVGTIRNSALALLRIIDDILDASKIEAGKLDVAYSKVEVLPVIEGTAETLRSMSDSHDVEIRLYIAPNVPDWIMGDAGRLRQVLLNLLSNAVKYSAKSITGRKGEVWFLVELDKHRQLKFTFRDNGLGMSEDLQHALFEPFVQGQSVGHKDIAGTGLGLVITKSLIDLMKGQLTINSIEGEGSEFVFHLPIVVTDGPPSLHDISGCSMICLPCDSAKLQRLLEEFCTFSKVEGLFPETIEDSIQIGLQKENPFFLIPTVHTEDGNRLVTTLRNRVPGAKILRCTKLRSEQFGRIADDLYQLQARPILTSNFNKAVYEMTKSGEPSKVIPLSLIKQHKQIATQKRVLAVEDNEINQAVLSKQMELLGISFDIASNGKEGLKMWRTNDYGMILTDCQMPHMNGFEMTAAIRAAEQKNQQHPISIVAITANALQGEADKCRAAGMDDFLAKPVELNALREKLKQFLN